MLDDKDEFEKPGNFEADFVVLLQESLKVERQRQEARLNAEVFNIIMFAVWLITLVICGLGWMA